MSVDEPLKEKVSDYVLLHTEEFQIERNIFSCISPWVNLLWEKNRTTFFFILKDNKKKIFDEPYAKNPPDIDVYHIKSK